MLKLTRRGLIKQASLGTGAIGVLLATSEAKSHVWTSNATNATAAGQPVPGAEEALVLSITDPVTGTFMLMRGERAVTIRDRALVQHLLSLS